MASVADLVEEPRLKEFVADEVVLSRGREFADASAVRLEKFGPLGVTATVEHDGSHSVELASSRAGCSGLAVAG